MGIPYPIECKRVTLPGVPALLIEVLREPAFPEKELDVLKRQTRIQLEQNKTESLALDFYAIPRKSP